MRKLLTTKMIATLKPRKDRQRFEIMDVMVPALGVRVSATGKRTFVVVARFGGASNPTRRALGDSSTMTLAAARDMARKWVLEISQGLDPKQTKSIAAQREALRPKTFKEVSLEFLRLHVRKEGQKGEVPLRTADEIERSIKYYLWTRRGSGVRWRDRTFEDVKRVDIAELLDELVAECGAPQADHVLAILSKLCNWYALRSDTYTSPIVRGMKRSSARKRARTRVLSDDEIRALWHCTADEGAYGAFMRIALLTGQRRSKVAEMQWPNISSSGVWSIETEAREKGNAELLKLPLLARRVIADLPVWDASLFVFGGRFGGILNGFSKFRKRLDDNMAAYLGREISHWVTHDLRRTAKTLMKRANVPTEISERVLGHVIPGVEGIYDRYEYFDEKSRRIAAPQYDGC